MTRLLLDLLTIPALVVAASVLGTSALLYIAVAGVLGFTTIVPPAFALGWWGASLVLLFLVYVAIHRWVKRFVQEPLSRRR